MPLHRGGIGGITGDHNGIPRRNINSPSLRIYAAYTAFIHIYRRPVMDNTTQKLIQIVLKLVEVLGTCEIDPKSTASFDEVDKESFDKLLIALEELDKEASNGR